MSVAGSRLNKLIENLNQLCSHHPRLISDIRDSIDALKEELRYLQSVIGDFLRVHVTCPQRDYESHYLNSMSKQIIGIIDEAEDAVDTYLILAVGQKFKSWWMSRSLQPKELKGARKKIANMSDQVKQITEKHMRTLRLLAVVPQPVSRSGKSSYQISKVEEDHVVGFEKPAKKVLELVTEGPENLEVITIVGKQGLGKTTIANMVYKDPDVDNKYMIRAFVYISRQCNKKDVLLQILASFSTTNEEVEKTDENDLEKYVCKELDGKQYLIVLDDVWEKKDWDAIKGAFPNNDKRCRVLITTTNVNLAEHANPTNSHSLYKMDLLSVEDSEELLRCKVLAQDKITHEIKQCMHKIAEQCNGLPLAILLIAGVLWEDRYELNWWEKVSSILSEDASEGKILEIMYEHLSNKLKPCFIYLGVFREDYEIPAWKIVRLWISEGFIDGGENTDLEDTAEKYLEQLVQRNLVMAVRRRSNGKVKTCRLHDTLGQFCKKVAEEDNFFQEIDRDKLNLNSSGDASFDNYRRIWIYGPIILMEYLSGPVVSGKHVRSFLRPQKEILNLEAKHASVIPDTFKLLKVLEAHSLHLPSFWTDLSRLVLLKYLAVSTDSSSIPPAFSGLWNLQTLIVRTTSQSLKVEMDLWKMPHFRHFHTNAAASLPGPDTKSQKSEASNIRTLSTITNESCCRNILEATSRLKKLGVSGDIAKLFECIGDSNDKSKSKFGELQDLENLKLINPDLPYKPLKLPSHITCFPPQLRKLTLRKALLGGEEMSTLGKMEKLEVLMLKEVAFQENKWTTGGSSFPHLVHLYIGSTGFSSWVLASATQGAYFPELKTLKLNGCENLEQLPAKLVKIPSLQSVVLCSTNPKLASSTWKHVQEVNKPERKGDKKKNLRLSVYPIHHLGELILSKSPKINSDTAAESSSPSPQMAPEEGIEK